MLGKHLFIVIAIEHYNPLGIIRSLGEKGISPVYVAIKGKLEIASKSRYISKCHYAATVEEGYQILIKEYGSFDAESLPFVFCSDDRTMGYLDSHYDELKGHFLLFNAGENDQINRYMDKSEILKLAESCGLNYARTVVCENGTIPKDIEYPIITKSISPNVGGWKSDVFICGSEDELAEAYKKIRSPKVLLQKFINKKNELEYYGFSVNHGEDVYLTIATDYLYLISGYYSPYMNVFQPPYPEVQDKIKEMIRKAGFEGIFSVEFVVDENDVLYFLEINFRNATWSYASTSAGLNLPYLWAKGMVGELAWNEARRKFERFRAMVEPIDYGKRVDTGKITVAEWLADFKDAKVTYYYDKNDLGPYYMMMEKWEKLK